MLTDIVINISITAAVVSFGAFISGDLNAHADSNNSAVVQYNSGNNHGHVIFFDRDTNKTIKTISYDGGIHDMSEEIQHLKDAGYDLDNVPNSYDFSGQDVTYNLSNRDDVTNNSQNTKVRVFDRDGNYIETKYVSDDGIQEIHNKIMRMLREGGYYTDVSTLEEVYDSDNNPKVIDVHVSPIQHILNLKYVDQNGKIVYVEKKAVTNFGKTDAARYLSDNYTVNDNQRFVDNYNNDYTVKVTSNPGVDDSIPQKENDIISYYPSVNEVDSSDSMSTAFGEKYNFNANISIQDENGKRLKSYVLSSDERNIVLLNLFYNYKDSYDISSLPYYVDLSKGNQVFTVNSKKLNQENDEENNKPIGNNDRVVFKLIDQNNKFVEYMVFNTNGKKLKTSALSDRLSQERMLLGYNPKFLNEYIPDGTYNMDVNVIIPYKIDKINFVNQDNQLIFSSYHRLSSEGKIYYGSEVASLPENSVFNNDGINVAEDKPEQTIYISEDLKNIPYKRLPDYNLVTHTASIVSPAPIKYLDYIYKGGITYQGYKAVIILKDQFGKIVRADTIVGYENNIATFSYLSDENRADYDLSSLPKFIDLSLGMQTFVIKSLKPDDAHSVQIQNNQPKPENYNQPLSSNESNHNSGAQSSHIKPTQTKLKNITMLLNKKIRDAKNDTSKLKVLKKKMKKHATKKQKVAYKALQAKLSADKKEVKSYKNQEGKLTKYFKNVAIIKSDNKKIKSLTSQMKKLKKSHSKASKKKYAKVAKALKKANSSLKAATKFVNNYK